MLPHQRPKHLDPRTSVPHNVTVAQQRAKQGQIADCKGAPPVKQACLKAPAQKPKKKKKKVARKPPQSLIRQIAASIAARTSTSTSTPPS